MATADRSTKNKSKAPAALKKRRRRILALGCLGVFIIAVVLTSLTAWYLRAQAGMTYEGQTEALLPPETTAILTIRDLESTLDSLATLPAVRSMRGEIPLGGWLLASPTFHDSMENVSEQRLLTIADAADRFLRKYFGREFTLALLPPTTDEGHSAVLLIVQADLGFEENLAELAILFNPKLELETQEYNGIRLRRSRSDGARKSFSYCRLGSTILLALRTEKWEVLRNAVDRLDNDSASLADEALFVETVQSAPETGLSLFARPEALPDSLRSFPSSMAESPSWNFWFDYFEKRLEGVAWLRGASETQDNISLKIRMPSRSDPSRLQADTLADYADSFSSSTLLFAGFRHPSLPVVGRDVLGEMANSEAYGDKTRNFDRQWQMWTGTSLMKDWLTADASAIILGVEALLPGILGPIPHGKGMILFDNSVSPALLADQSTGLRPTPLGIGAFEARQRELRIYLNADHTASPTSASLRTQHFLDDSDAEAQIVGAGILQFQVLHDALQISGPPGSVWSVRTREKMQKWRTMLDTLDQLGVLQFRLKRTSDEWELRIELDFQ